MKKLNIPNILGLIALFAVVILSFTLLSGAQDGDDNPGNQVTVKTGESSKAIADENTIWHSSLDAALAEAKKRNTYVVVDVYADWCGWCKKLDKVTLSDPKVKASLKNFTLLKLNSDQQPQISRRYGVKGLPTTLVLNSDGEVVLSRAGYMPPEAYLSLLTSVNKKTT